MQTFLPYPDFSKTAQVLDYRRLGKQRVEAFQIMKALTLENYGWKNHPAVTMWKGFEACLCDYYNAIVKEWVARCYKKSMPLVTITDSITVPCWVGSDLFHSSHRSALLHKDFTYYSQFGWKEEPKLDYFWPTKHHV